MSIAINGTGTITGLSVGGLEDGIITPAELSTGAPSWDAQYNLTNIASINNGPLAGFRNRIINGNFDFWQRGTSTTTTGDTYLADRWVSAFSTGGTVSQETSSLPTGSRYAWKFVASASNSFFQMGQQIEYGNCIDFQNTTVTISFMARAVTATAGSTALIFRTRTIAGVDGACLFTGTNVNSTFTLTTSWTRYTVTRTLPATFGSLSLEFALEAHVSGDGIMLAQVQIEPGPVATPFEQRPIGTELALCQRYYQSQYVHMQAPAAAGMIVPVYFSVPMRATPNATLLSSGTQFNVISVSISSRNFLSAYFQFTGTTANAYVLDRLDAYSAEL